MIKQAFRDDVTAAHKTHAVAGIQIGHTAHDILDPRTGSVHQGPRSQGFTPRKRYLPQPVDAIRAHNFGLRHDRRAAQFCVPRVQDHKARILDPAVGVFPSAPELFLNRLAQWVGRQINRRGRRQDLAPAQIVVQKQPEPDQPRGPAPLHPRHEKRQQL